MATPTTLKIVQAEAPTVLHRRGWCGVLILPCEAGIQDKAGISGASAHLFCISGLGGEFLALLPHAEHHPATCQWQSSRDSHATQGRYLGNPYRAQTRPASDTSTTFWKKRATIRNVVEFQPIIWPTRSTRHAASSDAIAPSPHHRYVRANVLITGF